MAYYHTGLKRSLYCFGSLSVGTVKDLLRGNWFNRYEENFPESIRCRGMSIAYILDKEAAIHGFGGCELYFYRRKFGNVHKTLCT